MDNNQAYIQNLKIEEVPWHRITTAYGRATDFPEYLNTMWNMADMAVVRTALKKVVSNIEHQSTFWHATPFAMIFLVRIFKKAIFEMDKNEVAYFIVEHLLDFFVVIAECFHDGDKMEHAKQLPSFSDMLNKEYLWSEEFDEEEDEIRYEEDELFPDDLFYSFYYYAYQTLLPCKEIVKNLQNSNIKKKAVKLQKLL